MAAVHLSARRPVGYGHARQALMAMGRRVFTGSSDHATLRAHVGSLEISKDVAVELGEIIETTEPILSCEAPVRVRATEGHYPAFDGDLELVGTHEGIEVALEGRYRPPAGWLGQLADAVVLHRVAEESLTRLFEEAVDRLQRRAAGDSELTGVPFT